MPKNNYHLNLSRTTETLTTKGRTLEEQEKDEARKRDIEIKTREELLQLTDISKGARSLAKRKFILAHFSTHCRTSNDKVVPAEGALLEFSILNGIERQKHFFIRPGDLPLGTRSQCLEKARKTHNIPLEDDKLYAFSDEDILDEIVGMIVVPRTLKTRPIFCLGEEKLDVELVMDLIFKRGGGIGQQELPKVYKAEELTYYLEQSTKKYHKMNPDLKGNHAYLDSPAAALRRFQTNTHSEVLPCPFHEENYRVEFCSLALVRNRAFTIMDRLCDLLQVPMVERIHIPVKDMFKSLDIKQQELEESYRDVYATSAVVIPETNDFGTRVTRCGTKNGVTPGLPTDLPSSFFDQTVREFHNSSFFTNVDSINMSQTFNDTTTSVVINDDTQDPADDSALASSFNNFSLAAAEAASDLETTI